MSLLLILKSQNAEQDADFPAVSMRSEFDRDLHQGHDILQKYDRNSHKVAHQNSGQAKRHTAYHSENNLSCRLTPIIFKYFSQFSDR